MATADSLVNDPKPPPPPAAKQPARVVQLSRKLMAAAVSGSKSARAARPQKRPAPALPPEAKRAGERPQELNAYAAGKAKGAATSYMDLVSSLGELRALGEKGTKQLLAQVLPRLAQHELPPAALVPQLLQLAAATEDRRLLRLTYYLLQLVLGPGCAGTPAPAAGEAALAVVSLPGDISARVWGGVLAPETPLPLADAQLRALSAAARAAEGGARLDRLLGEAVAAALERAQALVGGGGGGGKARQREALEAWELHWACLLAARNALPGKALGKLALRSSLGIASPCAAGARHALALLTHAMQRNAAAVFQEDRDLPGWVAGAAAALEAGEAGERKGGGGGRRPLMRDRWARLELARLCGAAVYADWTNTQAFVQGVGEPFWRALVLLATRPDEEELVALEAIACIFGSARGPGQEARAAKLRARAWLLVSSEAGGAGGLAAAVEARLARALGGGGSEPLRVTACAAAGAVLEASARGGGRGGRGKEPAAMAALVRGVTAAVTAAALGGSGGPALRCAALEALLWTQAGSSTPVVPPPAVARCIAAQRWPRGVLQALLERAHLVLRAAPAAVRPLLQLAGAAAAAGAASVEPDQLLELWSAAMRLPNGKPAALGAALAQLASPPPARPQRPGAPAAAEAAAAAGDDAGRLLLLRDAAWWLGEHANLAAGEFAGSLPPRAQADGNAAPDARATPLEAAALDAFRSPQMAAVVSHLAHAALTLPPGPRAAAAQALAKVAVRSEEPYRLQCYSVLASLADASRGAAEPDAHGVSCAVQPALAILDALYSSRLVLERLARAYGRQPHRWPPAVAAQLRARNTLLEQRIQRVVCSLSGASYFPLGPLSRDVLTSGVEALASEPLPPLHTAVSASTPEAPLSPLAATAGRHSRASSMRSDAGTPLLGGPDPLAALTDNLGQHLAREASRKRAPAPWELAPAQQPIPEEGPPPEPPAPAAPWEAEEAEPEAQPRPMQERGVVVHAFRAEMSDELSVGTGEEVAVEAELDGWLHCANRYGVRGLVPASYVRLLRPGEAAPDAAAQLFGGYGGGASLHQREQSLDLLNQPDMLSALLGPPPEEDDGWGAAPAAFHARRLSSLGGGDAFDEYDDPAPAAGGVDGDMAIPEPAPEPTPRATLPADDNLFDDEDAPESPPPEDAAASDNPFAAAEPAPAASSNPFERADAEPAAADDNPFAEPAAPPPLVRAPPPGGAFDGQPVSARVDLRSEGSEPGSALRRSTDISGPLHGSPALSQAPTPVESLSRRHSRQASFVEGGLSRQASHLRQASGESAGAWAASRASSMELSAIRGTVLYPFAAEADDELSVAPGDAVVIQAEVDGWLQVLRPADGRRGLIPASYASAAQ